MSNISKLFIIMAAAVSLSYSVPLNQRAIAPKAPAHVRLMSVPVGNVHVIQGEIEMMWYPASEELLP